MQRSNFSMTVNSTFFAGQVLSAGQEIHPSWIRLKVWEPLWKVVFLKANCILETLSYGSWLMCWSLWRTKRRCCADSWSRFGENLTWWNLLMVKISMILEL
jgi:hypothetical protein